eukprot:scaffold43301_cov57-Phaeocystis_antarctica.AAC.1
MARAPGMVRFGLGVRVRVRFRLGLDGEGTEGRPDHDSQLGDGRDAGEREGRLRGAHLVRVRVRVRVRARVGLGVGVGLRLRGAHQVRDGGLGDGHGRSEDAADL